ncbi:uncharacterized protein IL334_005430 [Kwoniella shivajii]|uniref:Uncharacterized protein n=1 Tax=Kwoniella shivajii TaxID=564305 RepID=A0ABZ1D354_9TREE|nr:hypothetical protein IL334_005430 [Kwoniella shivajii]
MSDPNFPPNLNISPLLFYNDEDADQSRQKIAIKTYGIAGRVWEATRPLLEYFTPSTQFEPPCSLFQEDQVYRILELGSGQSVASLHLADYLKEEDLVVTTDLPEVMPLCEQSIADWAPSNSKHGRVIAQPLAWGDTSRTLALEESFFDSFSLYFHMAPVRGGHWDAKVFICKRWTVSEEWTLPDIKDVMNGGKGVLRGRSFTLVDDLFGSLEWDIS